jgi:signal transduction histidine kinase
MAERIATFIHGRQELLHGVSHEFRAPLARLRFAAEMGGDGMLEEMKRDIGELDALVEELLESLRLESDPAQLQLERVDPAPVFARVEAQLAPWRGDVQVDGPATNGLEPCWCDERLLERALRNLVANALRHARRTVRLACVSGLDGVDFVVEDDGPGVPPADRERVFDPFVRLDTARTRLQGLEGAGLGLAIVRRIAQDHRGSVRVEESRTLGGARFVLHVPSAVSN